MSTFAASTSATSGLQGYDLEGAGGKKGKRSFYRFGGKITVDKRAPVMAAGLALVTDDGMALFLKRSGEGDHAGEWCFPGGKIEQSETAEQAALREAMEEIGFTPDPAAERIQVSRIVGSDVDFTTFFQRVEEFKPTLDHEHVAYLWAPIDEPPDPLHPGVRAALALVISQATETTMKCAKNAKRTLYIKRRVRNGDELVSWAKASGFDTTLSAEDMHITIAYSKTAVDWDEVPRSDLPLIRLVGGARFLERLGADGEATVLRIESDDLARRHREIHAAGAVWKWPDFKPHITLSYNGAAVDIEKLSPPNGTIELGPEEWAEVKENWMQTIVEKADAGELIMENLSLFVQLRKVDAKNRIVYGTAVEEVADRAGEIFDYATSKPEFEKWSGDIEKSTDGKSKGNVRAMHGKIAAGKLTEIGFDDARKAIDVAAKIVDEDEWKKVEEGVYTGFSIGGSYLKRWSDGSLKRYTARPAEVSLVDLPCVPTATFSMVKADGSEELRKFHQPVADEPKTVANDEVAARAEEMAKASGKHFLDHIVEARTELEAALAKASAAEVVVTADGAENVDSNVNKDAVTPPPAAAETHAVVSKDGAAAAELAKTTPDDVEQVWVSKRLPGQTFAKKGDLAKTLIELEAKEAAAAAAAPVLDVLKAAVGTATADKAAEDVEKTADPAKPTKEELITLVKATDFAKATRSELRQVIKAARTAEVIDLLPEGTFVLKALPESDELKKAASLYFVSNLLHMLACVEGLEEEAEFTALFGGVAIPKPLTDRFGTVLVELGDIVASILDVVLAVMSEEERGEAAKSAELAGLIKRGARHNAKDKATIKTTHDAMVALDKSCCSGAMSKATEVVDLEKVTSENEVLKASVAANNIVLQDIAAGVNLMKAKMDGLETINTELKAKVEAVGKSTANVEVHTSAMRFSPVPPPAGTFRIIEKGIQVEIPQISEDELRRRGEEAQVSRFMGPR